MWSVDVKTHCLVEFPKDASSVALEGEHEHVGGDRDSQPAPCAHVAPALLARVLVGPVQVLHLQ